MFEAVTSISCSAAGVAAGVVAGVAAVPWSQVGRYRSMHVCCGVMLYHRLL